MKDQPKSDLTSKTMKTSELKKIAIEQHRIIMQIMEGKNVTKQLQQYAKKCLTDRKFLEIMNP